MNYPCIRCIVEYLEANQRLRLSSRCPEIRRIERSIPLHLERLEFRSTGIMINQINYKLKETVLEKIKEFTPGDISFYNRRSDDKNFFCTYRIVRSIRGRRHEEEVLKNFPEGVTLNSAMKSMGCFFFEGRQVITTRKLEVMDVNVLRLPTGFKIDVINQLETSMEYLNGISKFVQPKLKEIIIVLSFNHSWEHSLIQNAHQLCIKGLMFLETDELLNITHKNVKIVVPLSNGYCERFIRKWIADEREIGSSLSFITSSKRSVLEDELYELKKMFGGRAVDKKVTKEENALNETPINHFDRLEIETEYRKSNEGRKLLYCICLPMNSTSELQISLFGRTDWTAENKIDMEVVPVKSLPTLKLDKVEYLIKIQVFIVGTFLALLSICVITFFGILLFSEPRKFTNNP